MQRRLPTSTLFPYTTLFRSGTKVTVLTVCLDESGKFKSHQRVAFGGWISDDSRWKTFQQQWKRRSEEHTSELQSLRHLVCRLLLEKKKKNTTSSNINNLVAS